MWQQDDGHNGERDRSPAGDAPRVPQAEGPPPRKHGLGGSAWFAFFERNRPVWLGMLLVIASIAAGLAILGRPASPPRDGSPPQVSERPPSFQEPTTPSLTPRGDASSLPSVSLPPAEPTGTDELQPEPRMATLPPGGLPRGIRAGRVGIVIDDLGWTQGIVQQLRAIDPAIGLAVMPFAPYSREIAQEAHGAGMEVLVHVPMEPHGQEATYPQDGMLLSSMSPADMADQLRRNIEAVPYAVGVNNHMGSKLTEDAAAMAVVMVGLQQFGLFFLDSATTSRSVAYKVARTLEMPAARRDVFLDTDLSLDAIVQQLTELGEIAKRQGSAIGIGHPHAVTLEALRRVVPRLRQEGLEIVPVSRLVQ